MKHVFALAFGILFLSFASYSQADCAGVEGGSALIDDCGDCHQAYVYNFITHAVTFVDVAD
ncbi:MAG: hypothetical protein CMC99_07630, partial [Flavobacteriales bacterium]|nr:hypothetical protein [Flavobacteriales bacterium]